MAKLEISIPANAREFIRQHGGSVILYESRNSTIG